MWVLQNWLSVLTVTLPPLLHPFLRPKINKSNRTVQILQDSTQSDEFGILKRFLQSCKLVCSHKPCKFKTMYNLNWSRINKNYMVFLCVSRVTGLFEELYKKPLGSCCLNGIRPRGLHFENKANTPCFVLVNIAVFDGLRRIMSSVSDLNTK